MARSSVNLKKAPRRAIVEIDRTGSWGQVQYEHRLDCGHIEVRKRASTADFLACSSCVLAAEHENRQRRQREQLDRIDPDDMVLDPLGAGLAMSERDAAKIKAGLAARFGVSIEAVDVAVDDADGELKLSYAVVVLSADEIRSAISSV